MKRFLTMLICAAMLVSCFSATAYAGEPSAAAQAVIEMIFSLDENSTPEQLSEAVAAYNTLSEEDKADVWNYSTIEEIEQKYVDQIISDIAALGDLCYVDYFHSLKPVNQIFTKYNALSDGSKAKVTNIDHLYAAKEKIDSIAEWTENKYVNIMNSTLEALAEYTLDDMYAYLEKEAKGIYYYFEEVDYLDVGDPTTGYFDLENDNEFVASYKYAKLDLDIKVTDLDFNMGWPALKILVCNNQVPYWSGYDFINNSFYQGKITRWGQGAFDNFSAVEPHDFSLGVWHHLTVEYDNESLTYVLDGEVVFETTYDDTYEFLIFYPWLCNLEMTNVVFTNRYGKETLSPFRTHVNTPTGWALGVNDSEATMLDHVEESLDETRTAYNALSADEKELVVGAEQIERVQALIDAARAGAHGIVVENGFADLEYAASGDIVALSADEAPEGMQFDKWEIVSGDVEVANINAASTTFVMSDSSVEIKATYKEKAPYIPADANGDGKLNSRDVVIVMKAALPGAEPPANFVFEAADMNGDGKINSRDVIAVMKAVLAGSNA